MIVAWMKAGSKQNTTSRTLEREMNVPTPEDRPTLSIDEVGVILGIARQSAYNAAARGEIPTIRIGRRLLVPTAANPINAGPQANRRRYLV